jgi:ABC-type Fe3+/spermidine/putrescine transport system ATPase subunit
MNPPNSLVVELIAASKRYGQVGALRGISLAIQPGEIVAMLGPNGTGKTTSISLMLGRRQPTGGQARLFGLPPTDRRARSPSGVILQESGTTGVLTVRELVALFGTYYPSPLPTDQAVAMAGLADKAGARVATLSGGPAPAPLLRPGHLRQPRSPLPRRVHRWNGHRDPPRLRHEHRGPRHRRQDRRVHDTLSP